MSRDIWWPYPNAYQPFTLPCVNEPAPPTIAPTPFVSLAYANIELANSYFAGRLNTQAWDCATPQDQNKALVQATRAIDRLNFAGLRTSDFDRRLAGINQNGILFGSNILQPEDDPGPPPGLQPTPIPFPSPGQLLEFPRNGKNQVPQDIIAACCECALAFLDGVDPEIEMQNLNRTSQGFASARETYDPSVINMAFRHGIPSLVAWVFLLPYLQDPFDVTIRRV